MENKYRATGQRPGVKRLVHDGSVAVYTWSDGTVTLKAMSLSEFNVALASCPAEKPIGW